MLAPMPLPDDHQLAAHLDGVRAAHRTVLDALGGLDDATARRPSLLPGWTVAHVVTHIARNADSSTWVLEGALNGEERVQYPGGTQMREADIEVGAAREAAELVTDVRAACERLESTYEAMTPDAWDRQGLKVGGDPWPCRILPLSRWREVEVHHADLGLGYSPTDWPDAYVSVELPLALATVDDRVTDPADRRRLLTWLIGRGDQPTDLAIAPWGSNNSHYGG